jgi:hypothetical protein
MSSAHSRKDIVLKYPTDDMKQGPFPNWSEIINFKARTCEEKHLVLTLDILGEV